MEINGDAVKCTVRKCFRPPFVCHNVFLAQKYNEYI